MGNVIKHPIVIRDLIELATYIADDNIDVSEKFLTAAETTFKQLGNFPQLGKSCQFSNLELVDIRQKAIKGFDRYVIFYRIIAEGVEINCG
jgi:toxin ParE1/3/4